jgi:hypothetical protein
MVAEVRIVESSSTTTVTGRGCRAVEQFAATPEIKPCALGMVSVDEQDASPIATAPNAPQRVTLQARRTTWPP